MSALPPAPAATLLQVYEDDLATLERTLPQLERALMPVLNNRLRVQLRQVQRILSDVRWRYGPARNVTQVPSDDDQDGLTL